MTSEKMTVKAKMKVIKAEMEQIEKGISTARTHIAVLMTRYVSISNHLRDLNKLLTKKFQ